MLRILTSALNSSLIAFFVAGVTVVADAQTSGGDDEAIEAGLAATAQAERAKKRAYVGGPDEHELAVQASLPQPLRNPDAVPTPPKNQPKPTAD